jgi:hypothetical protein
MQTLVSANVVRLYLCIYLSFRPLNQLRYFALIF